MRIIARMFENGTIFQKSLSGNPHHYTAFASDLGLRPGQWPLTIPAHVGNGQPFIRRYSFHEGFSYHQELGCMRIDIIND